MIYLFDTSGINRLHDDPDCDAIRKGLVATNDVWVSALSVAEACGTGDENRRASLLQLQKTLTRNRRPLEIPPILIQRGIMGYSTRLNEFDLSVTENHGAWQVLHDPSRIDKNLQGEAVRSQKKLKKSSYRPIVVPVAIFRNCLIRVSHGRPRPRSFLRDI